MIKQKDVIERAENLGVPKSTVDKDWVLGHFVDAIYAQGALKEKLVFKVGTCLRKCWIDGYRFSEDLDFTSTDPNFVLEMEFLELLCKGLYNSIGLVTHIENLRELRHKGQLMGYEAMIKF